MNMEIDQDIRINLQEHDVRDAVLSGSIAQSVLVLRLIEEINILKSRVDALENKP